MKKTKFMPEKSEELALRIVEFLEKWGLFSDVQILTGGKCYSDVNGELVIKDELNPGVFTSGLSDGEMKDFSNPERLLDMTFEGPLHSLLANREYEVNVRELSKEAKEIVIPRLSCFDDEEADFAGDFMDFLRCKTGSGSLEAFNEQDWASLFDLFDKVLVGSDRFDDETFYSDGEVASLIISEFNELLESYGLWYEMGFSWSLTTYRC